MGAKQKRKTPSKSTESDEKITDSYSPVFVVSPSRQLPQGNLTGSERKLKDGAADLNNYVEKWSSLNAIGCNLISEISNIKVDRILSEDERSKDGDLYPETLIPLCEEMDSLLSKMDKVVSRLSGLAEMSRGVAELEKFNQSEPGSIILFQTWEIDKFLSVFGEVGEMYGKEVELKHCICENICHATERNTVMFYNAAWTHQPYIDDTRVEILLESLLYETKHKT